jgi:hypothetical protein
VEAVEFEIPQNSLCSVGLSKIPSVAKPADILCANELKPGKSVLRLR